MTIKTVWVAARKTEIGGGQVFIGVAASCEQAENLCVRYHDAIERYRLNPSPFRMWMRRDGVSVMGDYLVWESVLYSDEA